MGVGDGVVMVLVVGGGGIWGSFSSSTAGLGVQSYKPLQQPSHPTEQ